MTPLICIIFIIKHRKIILKMIYTFTKITRNIKHLVVIHVISQHTDCRIYSIYDTWVVKIVQFSRLGRCDLCLDHFDWGVKTS